MTFILLNAYILFINGDPPSRKELVVVAIGVSCTVAHITSYVDAAAGNCLAIARPGLLVL